MPFDLLEKNKITIPALGVNCTYKHHVTFGDIILIHTYAKEYTGVRMTIGYEITDKKTGNVVLIGETKHCFTDNSLKPISLKKYAPEFHNKFSKLLDENRANRKISKEFIKLFSKVKKRRTHTNRNTWRRCYCAWKRINKTGGKYWSISIF